MACARERYIYIYIFPTNYAKQKLFKPQSHGKQYNILYQKIESQTTYHVSSCIWSKSDIGSEGGQIVWMVFFCGVLWRQRPTCNSWVIMINHACTKCQLVLNQSPKVTRKILQVIINFENAVAVTWHWPFIPQGPGIASLPDSCSLYHGLCPSPGSSGNKHQCTWDCVASHQRIINKVCPFKSPREPRFLHCDLGDVSLFGTLRPFDSCTWFILDEQMQRSLA